MARLILAACIVAVLVAVPFSQAKPGPSTSVAPAPYGLQLSAQLSSASSPKTFRWRVELTGSERLTQLADGSIAVVTPWPADSSDDGTAYPPEAGLHTAPPLPAHDPYATSADPDGSMAADEAMHDIGPFDPAYADEYLPDYATDDPSDPDSPANANAGPPPARDTSDTTDPSDDEVVPESDPSDAVYAAEEARNDQVVALIAVPQTNGATLRIAGRDTVELALAPRAGNAYPSVVTADVIFNPDGDPATISVRPS